MSSLGVRPAHPGPPILLILIPKNGGIIVHEMAPDLMVSRGLIQATEANGNSQNMVVMLPRHRFLAPVASADETLKLVQNWRDIYLNPLLGVARNRIEVRVFADALSK